MRVPQIFTLNSNFSFIYMIRLNSMNLLPEDLTFYHFKSPCPYLWFPLCAMKDPICLFRKLPYLTEIFGELLLTSWSFCLTRKAHFPFLLEVWNHPYGVLNSEDASLVLLGGGLSYPIPTLVENLLCNHFLSDLSSKHWRRQDPEHRGANKNRHIQ